MSMIQFPVIDPVATGANICRLRKDRGLTVRDLQHYFGFEEPQAIYKWQRGQSLPSVDREMLSYPRCLPHYWLGRGHYDGWITDRGWTDYCVFFHEESKDGLPVLIFFYNPSKDPNDDLWYVSAYILSNGVFMGSEGILDSSERIDRRFESTKKWA